MPPYIRFKVNFAFAEWPQCTESNGNAPYFHTFERKINCALPHNSTKREYEEQKFGFLKLPLRQASTAIT